MVGSAVCREIRRVSNAMLLLRTREQLNLCDQAAVDAFFATEQPDCVVFTAAKVGGIYANHAYPAEFAYENVTMAANAVHSAYRHGVERFLYLGSTCIYPRMAPQPIAEESLLTSPLEITNEAYALAKIMGLKLCQYYRQQYGVTFHSAMPTNLYGPGDNYHPDNSHVIPGLIRRFHEAKKNAAESVLVWGSGKPRREFLHVDDLAAAMVHLLSIENPPDWANVGTGKDLTIGELARLIARIVGFEGRIEQDLSRPDGTPVKRTDIGRITATGWQPTIEFEAGLRETYADFLTTLRTHSVRSN